MQKLKSILKNIPYLPTVYRKIRDNRLANREAVTTPFGFRIIGNDAMQRGVFEPADTTIFRKLVEDVDVVVDVGAHVGYYCLQALSLKKRVIAFEPMSLNMRTLLRNIALNGGQDQAEVFQLALADKLGIREMYGGGTGASLIKGWAGFSPKSPALVAVSSLDLVVGSRLHGSEVFVLIDAEGAEFEVLKGAKKLLESEPKPIWMVEIVLAGHQPKGRNVNPHFLATFESFWEAGYAGYYADENKKPKLLDREKVLEHIMKNEDFFSNFVFVHESSDDARKKLLDL